MSDVPPVETRESTASSIPPVASPPKPGLSPSRIIVFALLAVALVALAFDVTARLGQRSAYGKLQPFVDEDSMEAMVDAANAVPCTPSHVRELLGRSPDNELKAKEELQQTYSWKGVFNRYHVIAHYGGITLAPENPAEAEPLLQRVEQSSNYVWDN